MTLGQVITSANEHALIIERDEALAKLDRARIGVTVIVPCYEQQSTLNRAVESALDQTVKPVEVIVIDDGSPKPITCTLKPPPETRLRVVRITNRGLPSARNTGLMLCRTVGYLPLDADDWLEPTYIEKTLPLLLNGADVVLTGLQEHGPTRNKQYKPGFDRHFRDVSGDLIIDHYNRFFYAALLRATTIRKVGGYNSRMSEGLEDADLWVTLLDIGATFAAIDDPLLNYSTANPDGMLKTIHQNGGYERMVTEMKRHRLNRSRS